MSIAAIVFLSICVALVVLVAGIGIGMYMGRHDAYREVVNKGLCKWYINNPGGYRWLVRHDQKDADEPRHCMRVK